MFKSCSPVVNNIASDYNQQKTLNYFFRTKTTHLQFFQQFHLSLCRIIKWLLIFFFVCFTKQNKNSKLLFNLSFNLLFFFFVGVFRELAYSTQIMQIGVSSRVRFLILHKPYSTYTAGGQDV